MGAVTHAYAGQLQDAYVDWPNDENDDRAAIRYWLWRNLGKDAGPYIYIEPVEGTFQRRPGQGAITLRTLPVTPSERTGSALAPTYVERMQLVLMAYGADSPDPGRSGRAETVELGRRIWRLLHEGEPGCPPFRIPMYSLAARTRVAGKLRVLPTSLTMGLEDTTDEGLWSRSIEVAVEAPRIREVGQAAIVDTIGF